jgi:hypothetical protein
MGVAGQPARTIRRTRQPSEARRSWRRRTRAGTGAGFRRHSGGTFGRSTRRSAFSRSARRPKKIDMLRRRSFSSTSRVWSSCNVSSSCSQAVRSSDMWPSKAPTVRNRAGDQVAPVTLVRLAAGARREAQERSLYSITEDGAETGRIGRLGWMTGFEPATSGATVRRSATELHPPQDEAWRAGSQDRPSSCHKQTSLAFASSGGQTQDRRAVSSCFLAFTKSPGISTRALSSTATAVGWTWSALRPLALYINWSAR